MREIAGILLKLMYSFLYVSSRAFEKKQRLLAESGQTRSYPVLEALHGRDVEAAFKDLNGILWGRPMVCLPHREISPRVRALRFRMTSCAMSSLHLLIRLRRKGCPYKLFLILNSQYEEVLQTPLCMRDPLTEAVLGTYDAWLGEKPNIFIVDRYSC